MPQVITVGDKTEKSLTESFSLAKFSYPTFNPIQSRALEFYDKDKNFLSATHTGSGKTVIAEMFAAHEIRHKKRKVLYVSPLKTLAQQKYDDWLDKKHHFSDCKISICTGDYQLTPDRKQELEAADIIIMSFEMLTHRVRHHDSERSNFLREIGTFVVDEVHMIGDQERGPHLECGIMKFVTMNPDCRIVALSGTMPNSFQVAGWLTRLTNRDTVLLKSDFRPVPVNKHFVVYEDVFPYDKAERNKAEVVVDIVEHHSRDKFLVFVHTKKMGHLLKAMLQQTGIKSEFHNADLGRQERNRLEHSFLTDPQFRVVIATSTLSAGVNLPARRVIVVGVHRGLQEVSSNEIMQEVGRSGRPGLDDAGDGYVLIPDKKEKEQKKRINTPEEIHSAMLSVSGSSYRNLAFHIIHEICQGSIQTQEDLYAWYSRTLCCFQHDKMDGDVVESVLEKLLACNAIFEESGKLTATSTGKIASLYYYSPFDVAAFRDNFERILKKKTSSDIDIAHALGATDTNYFNIMSKAEKEQVGVKFTEKIHNIKDGSSDGIIKAAYAYHCLITGVNCPLMAGYFNQVRMDFSRTLQVLTTLNSYRKWGKKGFFEDLYIRVQYGVPKKLVSLCRLPEIGRVRAQKLFDAKIKTYEDIVNNRDKVNAVLGLKKEILEGIFQEAQQLWIDEKSQTNPSNSV